MSLACPARLGASLRFLKNLPTPDNRSEARSSNKARRKLSKSVQALTCTYLYHLVAVNPSINLIILRAQAGMAPGLMRDHQKFGGS